MAFYSHSKISTFEQCPLKYKYKYIDKIPPKRQTIEAVLGSCVHDSLEWVYNNVKQGYTPQVEEVIKSYKDKWEEKDSEEIEIVKENMTKKDYFNKGVEFILNYYTKHYPFKDGTIECEKKVIIPVDEEKGHKIWGFIDRFVYNYEKQEFEVHDYKTANSMPSKEKMQNDRQLPLYSIAIKNEYGYEKPVSVIWHFLAHNQIVNFRTENQKLEELKEQTRKAIEQIENCQEFPPCPSKLCNWCEYSPICPEFNNKKLFN